LVSKLTFLVASALQSASKFRCGTFSFDFWVTFAKVRRKKISFGRRENPSSYRRITNLPVPVHTLKSTKKPMLTIKSFTFNPVQENTYVLYNDKKECCIIDPGCYFEEERDTLTKFIEESGLQPVLLLNTHCHLDHVFGNQYVFSRWGLIPHLHKKEKPVLDRAGEAGMAWQMPFENYEGEVAFIEEGTSIQMGDEELEIRFTPGHSPGSVVFYHEAGGFVIGGDVLFSGSIGRTDLPGGNFDILINSIQTQLFTLPDETKVYPGHGPLTTIGFEKMNNPFVKLY
jgi:hydroxyacylglutathione hydrolase